MRSLPANNRCSRGRAASDLSPRLIKACLNALRTAGLRLIEVDKADATDHRTSVEVVASRPEYFIDVLPTT